MAQVEFVTCVLLNLQMQQILHSHYGMWSQVLLSAILT